MYLFIAAPCTPDKEVEQLEGLGGKRGQVSRAGGAGAGEGSVKKSRRSEREVHHEVLSPLASICFIYQNKTYQTVFSREIRCEMCSACHIRPSRAYLETHASSETHKLTPVTFLCQVEMETAGDMLTYGDVCRRMLSYADIC